MKFYVDNYTITYQADYLSLHHTAVVGLHYKSIVCNLLLLVCITLNLKSNAIAFMRSKYNHYLVPDYLKLYFKVYRISL